MQKQKDVPIKQRIITAIVVVGIFCVLFICMFFISDCAVADRIFLRTE